MYHVKNIHGCSIQSISIYTQSSNFYFVFLLLILSFLSRHCFTFMIFHLLYLTKPIMFLVEVNFCVSVGLSRIASKKYVEFKMTSLH